MNDRVRMIVLGLAIYAAVNASAAGILALLPSSDPHAFMRDPKRCDMCHIQPIPSPGRPYIQMNFVRDITSLCGACHLRPVTHPIDIAPGQSPSRHLPLDPDGTMTCVTCHTPHGAAYGRKILTGRTLWQKLFDTAFPLLPRRHRTYFLRLPTANGELCDACHARRPVSVPRKDIVPADPAQYAGSSACAKCHPGRYAQWKRTPHARMLRSPRKDPSASLASSSEKPLPFPSSEIAYVLGSRNVQRFISRKGDVFVVRTPIWLIRARQWNLSYWREMEWFRACAGCHTTGLNPFEGRFAEEGIGCESCHGPGAAHARSQDPKAIVHPGRLAPARRTMICESCHTTGHDITGEFHYPVGYRPGEDLQKYYSGLVPKPGQDDNSYKGDESYPDRHNQYLFWLERMLLVQGETCDLCKNFRLAKKDGGSGGPQKMTADEFCRSCHDGTVVSPPRHHSGPELSRTSCLGCHPMARNADGDPSIHDHKFIPRQALPKNDFIPPSDFRSICYKCHSHPASKGA